MALGRQSTNEDLVAHSDRGSQYAAEDCRRELTARNITASMSRKGNCYDNAFAESFFRTLKVELVYREKFKTKQEAMRKTFEHIEVWYNKHRTHSSLGYMTPTEYEQQQLAVTA
jgi:putative transposase